MADHVRCSMAAGTIMLGAALQFSFGGPWLLIFGTIAMGYCIIMAADDRHCIIFTMAGCTMWTVLHWSLGRNLTRLQVALEIVAFMSMAIMFWIVRLVNRERFAIDLRSRQRSGESLAGLTTRLKRIREESEAMTKESEGWVRLFSVMRGIGEVIRVEEIVDVIHATMREHLRLPVYVLLLIRDGHLRVVAQKGFSQTYLGDASIPTGADNIANWFLKQRDPLLVDNMSSDPRLPAELFPFRSMLALPIWSGDKPLGTLLAFDPKGRTFAREDFARAGILTRQLALGTEKAILYEQVQQLSITDGLTHLYTHRYFQERLEGELERARRYGRPLSLLLADLDHFKNYNDTAGHLEGDEMLKYVSRLMEKSFRPSCILARYGGEEFAVLIPDSGKEEAAAAASSFRAALADAPPQAAVSNLRCTISIGVATFPVDAQSRRDLIARADAALYKAKHDGRNRVCIYDPKVVTEWIADRDAEAPAVT